MDPKALVQNASRALRTTASTADAVARVAVTYEARLPKALRRPYRQITFDYPAPIGRVTLALRGNNGVDCFIHGEVFEHLYYKLDLPFVPKTILDLGSFTGLTAVYFGKLYPEAEIVCVEPMPHNFQLLLLNTRLNDVAVTTYQAAIDAVDGVTRIDDSQLDYGFKVAEAGLRVNSISVPTIQRKMGWASIDLLKIDIEGHESVLLKENCDWLLNVRAICIEIHDSYSEDDLRNMATSYGFRPPVKLPGIWLLQR